MNLTSAIYVLVMLNTLLVGDNTNKGEEDRNQVFKIIDALIRDYKAGNK